MILFPSSLLLSWYKFGIRPKHLWTEVLIVNHSSGVHRTAEMSDKFGNGSTRGAELTVSNKAGLSVTQEGEKSFY